MIKLTRRDAITGALIAVASSILGRKIMSEDKSNIKKMPTLFIGHGSPMNAIENNDFTQSLQRLGKSLPKPKAILMISAHWETNGSWLTGMEKPKTIHDFHGFPKELFDVQYPALGAPQIALNVAKTVKEPIIGIDNKWGLDHGTWSVLKHIFPNADVPVFQLSLDRNQPMSFHYELGKQLSFLREQGVMIMGSGNIVHNLREVTWGEDARPHDWAIEFDEWSKKRLLERDFISLVKDPLSMRAGQLSIPTLEHYLPLLYVLGTSSVEDTLVFDYEGIQLSSMSMRCLRFT
ncbi:4,5-DOPA dioxygenase extradiol [Halobacteriovorax marinus]|uniref:4,5-DOPA-extradiol-dioxygenase n=1 Tax=Halobacteriovorax marinus TaxID=97084 RepID=UPI003A90CBBD